MFSIHNFLDSIFNINNKRTYFLNHVESLNPDGVELKTKI